MRKFYKVTDLNVAKSIRSQIQLLDTLSAGLVELGKKYGFDGANFSTPYELGRGGFQFLGFMVSHETLRERRWEYSTPEMFEKYISFPKSWKTTKSSTLDSLFLPKIGDKELVKDIEDFFKQKGFADFKIKSLLEPFTVNKEFEVIYPHQFTTGMTRAGVSGYTTLGDTVFVAIDNTCHYDEEKENFNDVNLLVCEEITQDQFMMVSRSCVEVKLDKEIVSNNMTLEFLFNMSDEERQAFLIKTLDYAISQELS